MTSDQVVKVPPLTRDTSRLSIDLLPILLAVAIFSAASIYEARASEGFLEADSCTHYLYARFALFETHYLVNIWGRPLVTGLYAIPAFFHGRMGVRLTSLGLALACGLIAYAIARTQKYRWPVLALIFTLAQPLVFLHSFSELTELPFAVLLGLAFLAYQWRQFLAMTILIGLSPLARPEGFGLLGLAAIALVVHRRWWWLPVVGLPVLAWDYWGWHVFGSPAYQTSLPRALHWLLWLKTEWPYAQQSVYQSGSILHYVLLMPAVASPLIFPATCIGAWWCLRAFAPSPGTNGVGRGEGSSSIGINSKTLQNDDPNAVLVYRAKRQRIEPLRAISEPFIAVIPILILVGHSILYATGRMASSGEMRYMLVVAPFWGLLSAKGWAWIFQCMNWRRPLIWAGIAAILPAAINQRQTFGSFTLGYQVLPLKLNEDMLRARRIAEWYQDWPLQIEYPHMLAAHPGVYYFLDISPTRHQQAREWKQSTIAAAPSGTMLIWDPVYGVFNSDSNRSVKPDLIEKSGWIAESSATAIVDDPKLGDGVAGDWQVWLSPMSSSHQPTIGQ